jgi:hypothetical protein
MRTLMLASWASVFLTGCASVVNIEPNSSEMQIVLSCGEYANVPGQCLLRMGDEQARIQAPGKVRLVGQMKSVQITCESVFFSPHSMAVYPLPKPSMAGNLVLGGLLGVAVDSATGKGWTFPAQVVMNVPACFK